MVQRIGTPSRDKEVRPAVVIVVADAHSVAISPRQSADAGPLGHIFKAPPAAIAEKSIAWLRVGGRGLGIGGTKDHGRRGWRKRAPLNDVDIEPAVAVEVEEPHAATARFGKLVEPRGPVVEDEFQPGSAGIVPELRDGGRRQRRPGREWGVGARARAEVGREDLGEAPVVGQSVGDPVAIELRQRGPGLGIARSSQEDQGQKTAGLEPESQGLGQAGHLGGESVWVSSTLDIKVFIAVQDVVECPLPPSQLVGEPGITGLERALGPALQGRDPPGIALDPSVQGTLLGLGVTATRREPGAQLVDSSRRGLADGQMGQGLACVGDAIGRQTALESARARRPGHRAGGGGRPRATSGPRRIDRCGSPGWREPARPGRPERPATTPVRASP